VKVWTQHRVAAVEKELRSEIRQEYEERRMADRHIENRLASVATEVHTQMGKFELLKEQLHQADKERIRELEKMRQEMVTGFARLQGMLRSRGFHNHMEEDT
jgi:DNA anti-recombination protein RmuC